MAWSYPVLSAMKALAVYASEAVSTAAKTVYVGLTDEQASRERYALACRLVLANPDARKAAQDILSKAFVGFLMRLSPVASALIGFAVEIAYQSFKAASAAASVPPRLTLSVMPASATRAEIVVLNETRPPAPESLVDPPPSVDPREAETVEIEHEQAEPGDTQ